MSRDIVRTCPGTSLPRSGGVLGLVVAAGIEGERPDQRSVLGQHAHVEVRDEHEDADAGVAAAQPDVVEPAVVAQGDDAGAVDLVVADAVVGRDGGTWRAGGGLRPGGERGRGRAPAQRPVGRWVL
jgi:hypothetical protein